jgi:type I restriction enzyme R subunit
MQDGIFRRRRLPHWDVEDGTYFVTSCLAGSIPAEGLLRLRKFREQLDRQRRPETTSVADWQLRQEKLLFAEFDEIIDQRSCVVHLANPAAASEVEGCLHYFAGERYDLFAYVVMPSHFHWVFRPRASWVQACVEGRGQIPRHTRRTPRERIMKSVKGYSAFQCNRILNLDGAFWQDESYDHVVRDEEELFRIIDYIENNPVKAGLVDRREKWQWSSARERIELKVSVGQPLPGRQFDSPCLS